MAHHLTEVKKQLSIQLWPQLLKRLEEDRFHRVFDILLLMNHYDPDVKEKPKLWASKTDPRPNKLRRNKSPGKLIVKIFSVKSDLIKH